MQESPTQSIAVPIAIVIGFGLIAVAIFFTGGNTAPSTATGEQNGENQQAQQQPSGEMRPVTEDDYIRGNPNAPILLVEYSDYDCPFCKDFHDTMQRIMAEYGTNGQVAWVYRHFPLQSLHPNAPLIAHAAECVGELGGNDAFWTFTDLVFEERDTNEPTNMTRLDEFAEEAGVNANAFNECNESGRFQEEVVADLKDAVATGGEGTPHTVVVVGDQQATITGARPYSQVKNVIDDLLSQMEGAAPGADGNEGS